MVACENNVKYLGFSFLKIVLALQPQPIHLLVLPSLICPCSQLLFWCRFVAKTTCGQVRVLIGFSKQYFQSGMGKKNTIEESSMMKGAKPIADYIQDKSLHVQGPRTTCGKILAHSRQQVALFRNHVGAALCVFKIGVTANPQERFQGFLAMNFTLMWVICKHDDLGLVHMLEAALVAEWHHCTGCRNAANSGGEGALNRPNHEGPPYYVYITGGRADQLKRVGWKIPKACRFFSHGNSCVLKWREKNCCPWLLLRPHPWKFSDGRLSTHPCSSHPLFRPEVCKCFELVDPGAVFASNNVMLWAAGSKQILSISTRVWS